METTQVALSKGANEHVVECHSVDWWVVQDAMNFGYRKEKKAASTSQPLTKENILYILLWSNSGKGELIYDINRRWTLGKLFYGCDKYHAQKNIYLVIRFQRGKCPSQLKGWLQAGTVTGAATWKLICSIASTKWGQHMGDSTAFKSLMTTSFIYQF